MRVIRINLNILKCYRFDSLRIIPVRVTDVNFVPQRKSSSNERATIRGRQRTTTNTGTT